METERTKNIVMTNIDCNVLKKAKDDSGSDYKRQNRLEQEEKE